MKKGAHNSDILFVIQTVTRLGCLVAQHLLVDHLVYCLLQKDAYVLLIN